MGRYDPTFDAERPRDGRNVAPDIGLLEGEGALQRVKELETHERHPEVVRVPPSRAIATAEGPSYYGMPVLKEPVWKWMIPGYFFVGGLAGACAVLGGAAQAVGGPGAAPLVRRCRVVAAGGALASAALLVADLGRPARFIAMLRVFRPTSPMNMGTWILTKFGALSGLAALPSFVAVPPLVARAADAAGYGAAALGLPLTGYTGVLISNTAVPVWQAGRRTLPVLFAFSGAVSAGALMDVWPVRGSGNAIARRFGVGAKIAELAFSFLLGREARAAAPRVARPLHRGRSGVMLDAARLLIAASLAADLLPRARGRRPLSGALALLGTLALRFGIISAGRASARDPHATFDMQRHGRGAAELAKKRKAPGTMPSLPGVDATGKESFDAGAGV